MKRAKGDYAIQTVSNALALLESFSREEELGVTELSRRLDLHKNNVFRLLATLEQAGFVEQSSRTDRYRLGARCLELGRSFSRNHGLLRLARPLLEELAEESGEAAHLGILRDFEVVHLDGVVAERLLQTGLRTGLRLPAHCTALGKALLGCGTTEVRAAYDRHVAHAGRLQARTARTETDPSKLMDTLLRVGGEGVALDDGECEDGLACVAAPVLDGEGRAVAAISLSAPAHRLGADVAGSRWVAPVVAVAERLSRGLGRGTD